MNTREELFKALRESSDQAQADGVLMRLYDGFFKLEKGMKRADVVTPREAHRRMGKWLKEQYYFDMFRRDYPLPEGTIEYGDKPDFILHGARKIGIEITNFYLENGALPGSEQVQSRAREAVVLEAQGIYLANGGGKRIKLSLSFDKTQPIQDQRKLAKKIAELARRLERLPAGQIWRENFEEIPELSSVYLSATEDDDAKWGLVQGYSGQFMSRDKLLEIVSKKEAQSKKYRPCDAYWLVVVVDFISPAQDQEIRVDGFEKIHSTVFEKVIVYKTGYGQVLEASR